MVKGNTTSNCRVFPGPGRFPVVTFTVPSNTSVLFVPRFSAKVVLSPAAEVASFLAHLAFLVLALRERRDSAPPLPEEAYSPLSIQTACPRP